MRSFLETVREACPRGVWAQGVKLARADAVLGQTSTESEVVLRVEAPGLAIAPTVVLYPTDEEWDCDCASRTKVCAHVAAATIALTVAREGGQDLPVPAKPAKNLRYVFVAGDGQLVLDRYIVSTDGSAKRLEVALMSIVSRRGGGGSGLTPTHADLEIDRYLATETTPRISAIRAAKLLSMMVGCSDVRLGDVPVGANDEPVLPVGRIHDHAGGVLFTVEQNSEIDEVVAPGVALCGTLLRPLGATAVTGTLLENLPLAEEFPPDRFAELVTEVLPPLQSLLPVAVETEQLPESTNRLKPRIQIDVYHADHTTLSVFPTLVYGEPAHARIDADKLVYLRDSAPVRDARAEQLLLRDLRNELHLAPGRKVDFVGRDAMAFAKKLERWGGSVRDTDDSELFNPSPLTARFVIEDDEFDVVFETGGGEGKGPPRRAQAAYVLRAWRDGLDMVPLEGGGWAPLPNDWLDKYGHRVADLLASRDDDGSIPTHGIPALAELCDDLDQPRPTHADKLAPLIDGFESIPDFKLPKGVTATLRNYQAEGVNWLSFLRDAGLGALLADDMGLGKTLQALCAVEGRSLVVCPRSVVHNWAAEIVKFRPSLSVAIYHGPKRELDPDADVTLTTYALLRIDREELHAIEWDTIILDEAQAIKNPTSQVAQAAYGLNGEFRVAMTGTPVENRLDELWSLFHFLNRGLLGGRSDFRRRYVVAISRGKPGASETLRKKIRPFLLRRLKKDVAPELPPRTDSVLHCVLDERERSVYDAIRVATQKQVVSKLKEGGSVFAALEALLRLRQACCHAALVPGQEGATSSKVSRLMGSLEEVVADGHKALVFSQWTSLLDLVEPHLTAAGIEFTRLDGATRNRGDVVEAFQDENGPPVMLVSLKAGGTGLNLTAADHVFLLDPWWNPAVEDQAADRTHRIGQDKPIFVYRMVAKDTVEERILALQERKRGIADAALGEGDRAASLTRDDLLALLE